MQQRPLIEAVRIVIIRIFSGPFESEPSRFSMDSIETLVRSKELTNIRETNIIIEPMTYEVALLKSIGELNSWWYSFIIRSSYWSFSILNSGNFALISPKMLLYCYSKTETLCNEVFAGSFYGSLSFCLTFKLLSFYMEAYLLVLIF